MNTSIPTSTEPGIGLVLLSLILRLNRDGP